MTVPVDTSKALRNRRRRQRCVMGFEDFTDVDITAIAVSDAPEDAAVFDDERCK